MKNNIKETILKNAFSLFLKQGYEKTTTRQIAAASQLERGHLYYYYKKKEDSLFDIYSGFINSIYDFVALKYKNINDDILLMTITNLVYYDVIFLDERMGPLLNSVLSNSNLVQLLVQLKVEKIYEMYTNISTQCNEEMKTYAFMIIGAESQLILQINEGGLDLTYSDVGLKVVELTLLLMNGNKEDAKKTYDEAKVYADRVNKKEFYKFLCQNNKWARVYE